VLADRRSSAGDRQLTVNAIQAMAHAGNATAHLVIRTTLSDPHTLCCTFEDSGPGIKPEHLDHLLDASSQPRTPGWDWAYPFAAPSSKRMVVAFGPTMNRPMAALV